MGQSVQRPNELGAQEKQEEEQDGHGHRGHRSVNGGLRRRTLPPYPAHCFSPYTLRPLPPQPLPTTNHPTKPHQAKSSTTFSPAQAK